MFASGGGPNEDRTHDLRIANAALSQLSYRPDAGKFYPSRPGESKSRSVLAGARDSTAQAVADSGPFGARGQGFDGDQADIGVVHFA